MGGDIRIMWSRNSLSRFQSTPPHGGRHCIRNRKKVGYCRFNPRPRMGGDKDRGNGPCFILRFNPRPRMGGDRRIRDNDCHCSCFNPRPRMGGDMVVMALCSTLYGFNPRPRMGGDQQTPPAKAGQCRFQSTPPHGGRPANPACESRAMSVSIHAPAWGATLIFHCIPLSYLSFNPRPRMGGDFKTNLADAALVRFQSTPPHGGRPTICPKCKTPYWFQSTPPHGGRRHTVHSRQRQDKFQSTPPHGGRRKRQGS